MLKIKNENGITFIILVVTIIVLMILLSVSVDFGINSLDSTRDKKLQAELEIVQQICISEYTKAKQLGFLEDTTTVPANFIGTKVEVSNLPELSDGWVLNSEPTEAYKNYFRLTPEDLEQLNILNSEYTYIVNYYTGEVYNETKENSSEDVPLYIKSVNTHQRDDTADSTSFVDDSF